MRLRHFEGLCLLSLFSLVPTCAFRIKQRMGLTLPKPPTGSSRSDEQKRAQYCSAIPTVRSCLADEYCQAVVWHSNEGQVSRHEKDVGEGPSICCEPLQQATPPENSKYRRNLCVNDLCTEKFTVSKSSPCIQTVCHDNIFQDWCSLKTAALCKTTWEQTQREIGDQDEGGFLEKCKSLELFLDLPPTNTANRAALKIPGLQDALALERNLSRLDAIVEEAWNLYEGALSQSDKDFACDKLEVGHAARDRVRKVENLFVGKYLGQDDHWFYGSPSRNYFKDVGDNAADIASINVMITGHDMGQLSTTNLQTVSVVAWGAILDMIIDMYIEYETGKQAARQMIPVVHKACNAIACLARRDTIGVPVVKPLFDETLGIADCSPCKPFLFCEAAGQSCESLTTAATIIADTCDLVVPPKTAMNGAQATKSWSTYRSAALRKGSSKDFCFADGYIPGDKLTGGRVSDVLGKAIKAFWNRLKPEKINAENFEAENQNVIDLAIAAYAKAEAQCERQ